MEVAVAFGRVVRRLRKEVGLSQEKFGMDADLARNFVSKLELGQKQPTLTTIFKVASILQKRPSDIVALVEAEIVASSIKSPR